MPQRQTERSTEPGRVTAILGPTNTFFAVERMLAQRRGPATEARALYEIVAD